MSLPKSLAAQKRLLKTFARCLADMSKLQDFDSAKTRAATWYKSPLQKEDVMDAMRRQWSDARDMISTCYKYAERDYPEAARELEGGSS